VGDDVREENAPELPRASAGETVVAYCAVVQKADGDVFGRSFLHMDVLTIEQKLAVLDCLELAKASLIRTMNDPNHGLLARTPASAAVN